MRAKGYSYPCPYCRFLLFSRALLFALSLFSQREQLRKARSRSSTQPAPTTRCFGEKESLQKRPLERVKEAKSTGRSYHLKASKEKVPRPTLFRSSRDNHTHYYTQECLSLFREFPSTRFSLRSPVETTGNQRSQLRKTLNESSI